jgi:hypothetical protein
MALIGDDAITLASPILGRSSITMAQARAAWAQHATQTLDVNYTPAEVDEIITRYITGCAQLGIDALVALAQLALETTWLTSSWSAPPRRNPAGIGVTGEPGAGIRFPAWDLAVVAHLGRLLAYALPWGAGTQTQKAAIAAALAWRPLPDTRRGIATTVGGLVGTWAVDPEYGKSLIRVAAQIRPA